MSVMEAAPSFEQRAEGVVREFIRSVLLIDDDWPEDSEANANDARPAPAGILRDPNAPAVTYVPATTAPPAQLVSGTSVGDAKRLLRIQKSVTEQGVLFCGIRYPGGRPDQLRRLAGRADVLILDWHLRGASDDGSEALQILEHLRDDGGLHFVCMYTGQGIAEEVKIAIVHRLDAAAEGDAYNFRVANLIIAIRQKPTMAQGEPVPEEELYDTAVRSIAQTYHGLVQLGLLEITNRHRDQLPKMLAHLGPDIDAAVVYEATDEHSPVKNPSGPFLGILLDEWGAVLGQSVVRKDMHILSREGVRAFLAYKSAAGSLSTGDIERYLGYAIDKEPDGNLRGWGQKMRNELKDWIDKDARDLPKSLPTSWRGDASKTRWGLLNAIIRSPLPHQRNDFFLPLQKVDALFQQQYELPSRLTQGTVLTTDAGKYLICITPLCDAERPWEEINYIYTFLVGTPVDVMSASKTKKESGAGCTIRHRNKIISLNVTIKSHVTLRVRDPKIVEGGTVMGQIWFPEDGLFSRGVSTEAIGPENISVDLDVPDRHADSYQERGPTVRLVPVAQLRVEFALQLAQLTVADASRVGVERAEFIRVMFKKS